MNIGMADSTGKSITTTPTNHRKSNPKSTLATSIMGPREMLKMTHWI